MKKQIIRITEQDLTRIVEATVNEINWGKAAKVGAGVAGSVGALALGAYDDAQTLKDEADAIESLRNSQAELDFEKAHENDPIEDDSTYVNSDWQYESRRPRKITESSLRKALRSSLKKVLG